MISIGWQSHYQISSKTLIVAISSLSAPDTEDHFEEKNQYLIFIRLPAPDKEVLSLSHLQLTSSKPRPDRVFVIQPTSRKKVHQQAIILYLPPITTLFSKLFLCLYGPLLSNFWDYLELRRSAYSLYRDSVCLVNQLITFSTEKFLVTVVWLIGKHFVHNPVHICQDTSKTIFQNKGNIC